MIRAPVGAIYHSLSSHALCILSFTTQIVTTAHDQVVKFHRRFFSVSLRDLYFLYGGVALLFSFHGFYVDGHWANMQKDGNRLVLHLRLYSFFGLASCVAGAQYYSLLWTGRMVTKAVGF
jgi:hypothetical protein